MKREYLWKERESRERGLRGEGKKEVGSEAERLERRVKERGSD